MRLGLELGYLTKGSPDPVALAERAEAVGFDSVWVSEAWGSDGVSLLACIGARTARVALGTAILVLSWIYRANRNARQLGAADRRFTPGWAVGWYFIPIAWFWMPYLAMREIWRASVNPSDWGAAPVSPLLRWWWSLWIVGSWGTDGVDLVASLRLDEAGFETVDAATNLVGHVLAIPLAFSLVAIIAAVTQLQTAHHRRQSET